MGLKIYHAANTELIEGCKRHDRHAQRFLFDHFSGKMYALCCRYIKDKMEAEDVLIAALTKVLDRINQYKGDGSFEGWIRRIVVNESLTYLRKNKAMYLETDIDAADHEPDFERLESQMEADDLLKLIADLPPGYKIVFNMYAIDGYSHKEISEQLGISENTSKSQLSRARTLLQKKLMELERETIIVEGHERQSRQSI